MGDAGGIHTASVSKIASVDEYDRMPKHYNKRVEGCPTGRVGFPSNGLLCQPKMKLRMLMLPCWKPSWM